MEKKKNPLFDDDEEDEDFGKKLQKPKSSVQPVVKPPLPIIQPIQPKPTITESPPKAEVKVEVKE